MAHTEYLWRVCEAPEAQRFMLLLAHAQDEHHQTNVPPAETRSLV